MPYLLSLRSAFPRPACVSLLQIISGSSFSFPSIITLFIILIVLTPGLSSCQRISVEEGLDNTWYNPRIALLQQIAAALWTAVDYYYSVVH